jgi:pSer/pThr/pTyr-binding forkhead associated (FHA) protein
MQGTGTYRLIVRRGPQPNQIYELSKDTISLGRDITNDIVINDPEVSRHHGRLIRGGGGYTMEDLGSTNGTFINGNRLNGARPLNGGDTMGLGETVTLSYEAAVMPGGVPVNATSVGTMVGQSPLAQNPYAPPQPAQPGYPQQQGGYQQQPAQQGGYAAAPPPPPPQYQPPPEAPTNSAWRFVILGCGCLVLLCIAVTIIGFLYIDANNLYCTLPIIKQVVRAAGACAVGTPVP